MPKRKPKEPELGVIKNGKPPVGRPTPFEVAVMNLEQVRHLLADATSSLHAADVFKENMIGCLWAIVGYDETLHAEMKTLLDPEAFYEAKRSVDQIEAAVVRCDQQLSKIQLGDDGWPDERAPTSRAN